jgi:hypothetical protein
VIIVSYTCLTGEKGIIVYATPAACLLPYPFFLFLLFCRESHLQLQIGVVNLSLQWVAACRCPTLCWPRKHGRDEGHYYTVSFFLDYPMKLHASGYCVMAYVITRRRNRGRVRRDVFLSSYMWLISKLFTNPLRSMKWATLLSFSNTSHRSGSTKFAHQQTHFDHGLGVPNSTPRFRLSTLQSAAMATAAWSSGIPHLTRWGKLWQSKQSHASRFRSCACVFTGFECSCAYVSALVENKNAPYANSPAKKIPIRIAPTFFFEVDGL